MWREKRENSMIELLPNIFHILLSLAVVFVAYMLYKRTGKGGLVLIGLGFLILAIPYFIDLAMGGPTFPAKMEAAGYSLAYIGMVTFYKLFFTTAMEIAFAILVIVGLIKTARKD
jgi:uncharacterized membrane protein YwaF